MASGLLITRSRSPCIYTTDAVDADRGIHDHSRVAEDGIAAGELVDMDQKLSQKLLFEPSVETSAVQSAPVPAPALSGSYDELPAAVSMSPAMMFLSVFSPPQSVRVPQRKPVHESVVIDGYTLDNKVIGRGGFSTVHKATTPSGDIVAVKIIRHNDIHSESERQRLANEAAIWSSLSHEHILPLFRATHMPSADYFFMPFCPAGSLYDILARDGQPGLPHDDAGMMFRQVVRGVRYLHEHAGLVHGDLKLENVLVDASGVCRIADFGLTRPIKHDQAPVRRHHSLLVGRPKPDDSLPSTVSRIRQHHAHNHHHAVKSRHRNSSPLPRPDESMQAVYELPPGSLPYAAPELLHPPLPDSPYVPNPAQDVWALGVMLYALLTGRLPFQDKFEPRLIMKILQGEFVMPADVGRGAELVLRGCLDLSVSHRWTIAAVDDVAWSAGWGEDASVDENEIERMVAEAQTPPSHSSSNYPSTPASRSRSRAHAVIYEDEDECEASFVPVASPLRPRSARSRSSQRAPHSQLSSSTFVSSPISSLSSPSPSVFRGRDQRVKEHIRSMSSRSPSPSVPPLTPTDSQLEDRFAPFVISPSSTSMPRSLSRGRRTRSQNSEQRASPYRRPGSVERHHGDFIHSPTSPMYRERSFERSRRAGSQPPANSAPWAIMRARASVAVSPAAVSATQLTPESKRAQFLLQLSGKGLGYGTGQSSSRHSRSHSVDSPRR